MNGPLLIGEKPLPHSSDYERAVLCCFLNWPQELNFEFGRLRADDFYIPAHRRFFEAISKLFKEKKPIDIITVSDALDEMGMFDDIGGMDTIRMVSNAVPSYANCETYIQEVQKQGRARRLINVCSSIVNDLFSNDQNFNQILSRAENEIIKVANEGVVKNVRFVRDGVDAAKASIIGRYNKDPEAMGISSGYRNIDEMITGLQGGKTYIIAARPSIGKTTFVLNILSRMAMVERGAFFSLEMPETECIEKLISLFGSIDPSEVYSETIEFERLSECLEMAKARLDKLDLIIDDTSYYFEDMIHRIKLLYVKENIKYVAIDYLQLSIMIEKSDSKEQMVSKMSCELKKLAKALNIPIIILAQLNRGAEGRAPLISDLRDSGAIEQDADIVALLHRERSDSQEQRDKVENGHALETRLIISKNRGGKTGPTDLWFFPQYSNFQEPDRVSDSEIPE